MTTTPVITASGSGFYQHLFPECGSRNHDESRPLSRRRAHATKEIRPSRPRRDPVLTDTARFARAARAGWGAGGGVWVESDARPAHPRAPKKKNGGPDARPHAVLNAGE